MLPEKRIAHLADRLIADFKDQPPAEKVVVRSDHIRNFLNASVEGKNLDIIALSDEILITE